jgi:POT family proton-dependent oligopeptide transporter
MAPAFGWLWMRLGSRQPSSIFKFVLGLFFAALSFLLMVPAAYLSARGLVSPWWIVGLFFLQTVGELCLSPVGLSLMTKLAQGEFVGLALGIWFLASAYGNKLAGILAGNFTATDPGRSPTRSWSRRAGPGPRRRSSCMLVPWVKRLMGGVR